MTKSQVPVTNIDRLGHRLIVSRLQHGWLQTMGVDVPWIVPQATDEPVANTTSEFKPTTPRPSMPAGAVAVAAAPTGVATPPPAPLPAATPVAVPIETLDLSALAQTIRTCDACGLCQTRQNAVPGEGVDKPTILIVGEAPGEQEDRQGKPFVGRSGQLLNNMMKAIGHGRDTSVFITNVVKCRPPANRNPRDEEISACAPFLSRQIELLAPRAILAMGRFAAHALLNTDAPLQQLRQGAHTMMVAGQALPVVVTYHPAYLLRRLVDKRLAWEDLKRLKALVSDVPSGV